MTESEARVWIADILSVLARGAQLTPNVIDDRAVQMALLAIANDVIWGWIYAVLGPLLQGEELVMAVAECPQEVGAEADEAGIDPLTILAIINAIVELIKIWRNRRQ